MSRPDPAAAASPPDPLTNFVNGQLCVVVSADTQDPKGLYYAVLGWLNSNITSLVRGASSVSTADPVDRELNPGSLRPYLPNPDDGVSIVQWLTALSTSLDSWTVLDPPVQKNVRQILLYYGVGVTPVGADDPPTLVRRPTNAINQSLRLSATASGFVFKVDGATPNWFVVTASDETCGGPGGKSEAASQANWRIRFVDPNLESNRGAAVQKAAAQGGSSVVVAILDTCPDPTAVASAVNMYPKNWLLTQVAKTVHIGEGPSLSAGIATPQGAAGPIRPNWYGAEQASGLSTDQFAMADHGLFVAGLVRDAAPAAEIHLVRALGDYGVGTLQGLTQVLNQLPQKLNPAGKKHVIVNLSLMVDIPASYKIMERWFPGSVSAVPEGPRVQNALAALETSVRAAMDALSRQGVLVVAAAGNDALPTPGATRPLPRFPARAESVLSVAAVRADGTPASYSNQATIPLQTAAGFGPATKNGIAVQGGEATLRSGWSGPLPAPGRTPVPAVPALIGPRFIDLSGRPDAVVGIASGKSLTLGRLKNPTAASPPINTTGWVYWSGTSFATPIISAVAACVWELDPTLSPLSANHRAGVTDIVQGFAQSNVLDLGCNALQVKQS